MCAAELHVTASYTKTFSLAKRRFYGNLCRQQQCNVRKPTCKVPDAALKRKESSFAHDR